MCYPAGSDRSSKFPYPDFEACANTRPLTGSIHKGARRRVRRSREVSARTVSSDRWKNPTPHRLRAQRGPSIEDAYDEALNVPYILAKIRAAESEHYTAAIIDCFGDPALDAARELVEMPVIGGAQSACYLAAQIAPRFPIINTVREFVHIDRELVVKYGLSQHVVSVITIDIPVLTLEAEQKRTVSALVEATERAVRENGAQAVVLGCTGMSSLVAPLKQLARRGLAAPVIEPVRAAVHTATSWVFCGLSQSKEAFMPPRAKRRVNFPTQAHSRYPKARQACEKSVNEKRGE